MSAATPELVFRRLREEDLPVVVEWMSAPHAQPWYAGMPRDVAAARERYAGRIAGEDPVRMWVVEVGGRSVGLMQDYRVADLDELAVRVQDPEAVGFDYLIGEASLVGRGIGTRAVRAFLCEVLCRDYPDGPRFVACTDHRNVVSLRVLEKLGFSQGLWIQPTADEHPQIVCTIARSSLVESGPPE